MTDFHSHILPRMDDGSKSVEESAEMLRILSQQGITRVVATPHFYANDESVRDFLARRNKAFEDIGSVLTDEMPEIILGAEVRYYDGISRMEDIKLLRIQETEVLLLEMPEKKWTEYTLRELEDMACSGKMTLVLAHIDRYIHLQHPEVIYRLCNSGIHMQMNADFINGFFSRRKAISLLKRGFINFIGSDCHNTDDRKPDIGRAYQTLVNRLGTKFVDNLEIYTEEILETKNLKG